MHIPCHSFGSRGAGLLIRILILRFQFLLGGLLGIRILGQQLRCMHPQRRIDFQASFDGGVVYGIGIQLLVDPFRQTDLLDAFDVARARAIREAVKCVKNGFVGSEFRDRETP